MGVPHLCGWFLLGEIPSINGWWLGVPPWLRTPPCKNVTSQLPYTDHLIHLIKSPVACKIARCELVISWCHSFLSVNRQFNPKFCWWKPLLVWQDSHLYGWILHLCWLNPNLFAKKSMISSPLGEKKRCGFGILFTLSLSIQFCLFKQSVRQCQRRMKISTPGWFD